MELISLVTKKDKAKMEALLSLAGLRAPEGLTYACGLFDGAALVACGGYRGAVIQGLAVDPMRRGEALLNTVVSHLYTSLKRAGEGEVFIFTKPENAALFRSLGFHPLAACDAAALLTSRPAGIRAYIDACQKAACEKNGGLPPVDAAAILMNANPFTRGHAHLIETAAAQAGFLYVFVVEEEKSAYPFEARLALVMRGAAHVKNALVTSGGRYMISAATFPSYFIKDPAGAAPVQAALDAEIFAKAIAPGLNITSRYVGEEPLDPLTKMYNHTLLRILPENGVAVRVIPRAQAEGGVISASRVRALIKAGRLEEVRALVPETTYDYLAQEGREAP